MDKTGKKSGAKLAGRIAWRICKSILQCLLTVILVGIVTACVVCCVMAVYLISQFDEIGLEPIDLDTVMQQQSSMLMIEDGNGGYIERRLEGANSIWTDLDDIPVNMQNAMVAIEDERFWDHYGVDWKRTVSAVANLLLHFSSTEYGGSTITQQLIKIQTQEDDHSIERKIREIFRAVELERSHYSKEQILEAYLNVLPLSGNIVGVGAAANQYFDVEAKDLTLAQCAMIAGITQNPSKYNPWRYPENVRYRQRLVLKKMYELGFISHDEYLQAYNEELILKPSSKNVEVYDWYTDMVIDDVIHDLMDRYGYSEVWASQLVYYGGLKIYSCEDPALQSKIEAVFADDANFPAKLETDDQDPQTAFFVMDYSGRCVAVVGGRGEKNGNRLFNRATHSTQQPGSTIKPIGTYTVAVENNLINFSTPILDCFIYLEDGREWPSNYGSGPKDNGITTVDNALQRSLNTVPVRIAQQLHPQRIYNFLTHSLNLSTLIENTKINGRWLTDVDLAPMALGGLTYGVYMDEITAAYTMYGNGGYYIEPYSYYRVTQGDAVLLAKVNTPVRVISEDTAYVMNRLLQNVMVGPNGTGKLIKNDWKDWEVFCKSGTTQDDHDVYFVGGTTLYVGSCWLGYDINQMLNTEQTRYARYLWSQAMKILHEGKVDVGFTPSPGTVEAYYCNSSGLLASDECPKTTLGVYKKGYMPGPCDHHGPFKTTTSTTTTTTTGSQEQTTTTDNPETTTTPAAA